jgi:hypothetical protein
MAPAESRRVSPGCSGLGGKPQPEANHEKTPSLLVRSFVASSGRRRPSRRGAAQPRALRWESHRRALSHRHRRSGHVPEHDLPKTRLCALGSRRLVESALGQLPMCPVHGHHKGRPARRGLLVRHRQRVPRQARSALVDGRRVRIALPLQPPPLALDGASSGMDAAMTAPCSVKAKLASASALGL